MPVPERPNRTDERPVALSAVAEQCIDDLGLSGVIQIASFHPQYQFAESQSDDVENYTNRSPYPMLHLLREESVTKVAADLQELLEIPNRNMRTLREFGKAKIVEILRSIQEGESASEQ